MRIGLGVALLLLVTCGAAFALARPGEMVALGAQAVQALRASGHIGIVLLALAQIVVAVSGVLPAALLGAAAGALYGPFYGFLIAAISTLTGAQIAFVASRTLMRGFAERVLAGRPRLAQLDQMIAIEGWRMVCLLRLSPVMPFSATSYALGLSKVSPSQYAIGTLASLPALFGYVTMGALTDSGLDAVASGAGPIRLALLGLGVVATIILTLRFGALARRAGFIGRMATA